MKNILTLLCLTLLAFTAHTQSRDSAWGTWGIGPFKNQSTLNVYQPYHIQGYHIYVNWSDLEPTRDNFNWPMLDSQMRGVAQNNLWIGVQVMVGPNCPNWIYDSVPKVFTTGGNNNGPYPYYLNPYYKARFMLLTKMIANHFQNLPTDLHNRLLYWQLCSGSTGDEDPYKGTVTDPRYAIDYYTWEDFRHAYWDSVGSFVDPLLRYYRALCNSGNFAQDLEYVHAKFPKAFHKAGMLSHDVSFDGENLYFSRQFTRNYKQADYDRTRSEVQDIYETTWWGLAPKQLTFALVCSSLSGGLDMLNITPALISTINSDTRATDFFQKYAGLRTGTGANKAFIALRDVPDFADTVRFSTKTYGPVIDPASQNQYNKKIQNINNNPKDSASRKYWLGMKAMVQYENRARQTMIVNQFKPAGAKRDTLGDELHNDFGTNMTHNFRRFITQVGYKSAFDSSSIGAWRIGPDTGLYGRYARLCRLSNGQGQMYFAFEDTVVTTGEKLKMSVVYYDTGNGKWSLNCSGLSFTVTNTGTRQWLRKDFTITSFKPLQYFSGKADFTLKYISGTNTPFTLIEVEVVTSTPNAQQNPKPEKLDLTVSPNPNPGQLKVSFAAKEEEKYSVFITDVSGNSRFTETKQSIKGNNQWSISTNLERGSYVLHIESATMAGEAKFIVIK